jgi:uncharacterized protein (TIGR02246 family)
MAEQMSNDEKAIRETVALWMKASMDGDIETVLGLMTDDVVFMVVGQEPFGKDAFRQGAKNMGTQYRMNGASEIEEVTVLGDWAYARSHISIVMEPVKDARLIHRSGFSMSIWRKDADGRWRIARDANMTTTDPA